MDRGRARLSILLVLTFAALAPRGFTAAVPAVRPATGAAAGKAE